MEGAIAGHAFHMRDTEVARFAGSPILRVPSLSSSLNPPMHPEAQVFYVTYTSIESHLGTSQVVRPLVALAERGFRYRLVSVESAEGSNAGSWSRRQLAAAGIDHHPILRRASESFAAPALHRRVLAQVLRLARTHRPKLLHVRGYHPAAVARVVQQLLGVPYLFDARGYWIDEQLDHERWFTTQPRLLAARLMESELYRSAAAVVQLTEEAAEDVRNHVFCRWDPAKPCVSLPTACDFDDFRLPSPAELEARARIPTVAWVGSFNAAYDTEPALAFMRAFHRRQPNARLAVFTSQTEEAREILKQESFAFTTETRAHHEMPEALRGVTFGFLLRANTFANRASMPTKFAEFVAAGVSPIHFGGNDDLRRWRARCGTGVTLEDLEASTLEAVAKHLSVNVDAGALQRARRTAESRFSLEAVAEGYATLLSRLGVVL